MRDDLLWLTAYAGCIASVVLFIAAGGVTWTIKGTQTAAVFFVASITAEQIQNDYRAVNAAAPVTNPSDATSAKRVRILIMPGHQPTKGGTDFGGVYERNVVVDIADALATLLSQNPHYDVMVARTKEAWNPVLQNYFDTHALEIETFRQSQTAQMKNYLASGSILPEADQVYHNSVSTQAALQLYGINKWSSENGYDIILHLHINDYAGSPEDYGDKYNGFAVYVPDHQYSNAAASLALGNAIAVRLSAYHATSTLPKEDKGVVPDQQLIAIGSNNSVDGAALLVEYGYIFEPQFQDASVRPVAVADYAYQTYLGLQDFFKDPLAPSYGSVSFPYDWTKVTGMKGERGPGIYALQAALHHLGYYPPSGRSFSDCPISGAAKACTRSAVEEYQRARGLEETGVLGPETRAALNADLVTP